MEKQKESYLLNSIVLLQSFFAAREDREHHHLILLWLTYSLSGQGVLMQEREYKCAESQAASVLFRQSGSQAAGLRIYCCARERESCTIL